MNRGFYPRLAWTGMKQNRRLYLPYLLTCTGITAMFYILMGLSVSSVLPQMSGGRSTALIMSLGSVVIAVFALIFLFYPHSFLIRRRSREFGLYNVLGMGKGNIARILLWETLLTYAGTTVTGLALGVALSKLAELGLMNLLRSRITYTFTVNAVSLLITLALFAAVHTLIFLHALWQLHRVSAVALLHSESVGEKPPRARWALAVLGLVLLGGAYWLAVSIRDPLEALLWFFAAVIMVILGTYLLFITGSVALCRALQRNPRYYYQSRHFVSVSSMAYRMKRNGAGLASVCVLATMVLVMLSSTTCMYYGVEDALHQRYVRDINVECYFGGDVSRMSDENLNALRTALTGAAEEMGSSFDNEQTYRAAYVYGILTPEGVLRPALAETDGVMESTRVTLLPLSDYNAVMGADLTLAADEALVYGNRMTFTAEKFTVGGTAWRVRGQLDSCPVNGAAAADVTPSLFVVVPDFDSAANTMLDTMSGGAMDVQLRWYCSFDSDLPAEEQEAATALIEKDKCVLISQHADSLGAPTACELAGVPNVSYNGSTYSAGETTFIISSAINWAPYFQYIIETVVKGEAIAPDWCGTIATNSVVLSGVNQDVAAEGTIEKINDAIKALEAGTLHVFDTANFTVDGKTLTEYLADVDGDYTGETNVIHDGYFDESNAVDFRSAPYFDIIIDGVTNLNTNFGG